jgi:hypothetical protein
VTDAKQSTPQPKSRAEVMDREALAGTLAAFLYATANSLCTALRGVIRSEMANNCVDDAEYALNAKKALIAARNKFFTPENLEIFGLPEPKDWAKQYQDIQAYIEFDEDDIS